MVSDKIRNDEDLKLKEVDQLHDAIIQFNKKCFEIKKICITVLLTLITLCLNVNNGKIYCKSIITIEVALVLFWSLDAQAYYYQEKLRIRMNKIINDVRDKRSLNIQHGFGLELSKKRLNQSQLYKKVFRALFNCSQYIYILLILVGILIIILIKKGCL